MTEKIGIEEAIKTLRQLLAVQLGSGNLSAMIRLGDTKAHAIQLGIEALERERDCRSNMPREEWLLLPSEEEK